MSTTITIRTDAPLRRRLEQRADASGKSLSELVRELLEKGLAERTLGEKAGHLRGSLRLPREPADPWRRQIRERNWRP